MEGSDQISNLPEPVLQHIMSFLIVEDAAKTSILSKVWYRAWTSLSCLDFGHKYFPHSKQVVDQILAKRKNHNISIQRFLLKLPYHRSASTYVDNWIQILVACNIKELLLQSVPPVPDYHNLSRSIFAAKSLNVLRLYGFKLKLPSYGIKLSSLRELHLKESFLGERLLQYLCTSCSNLQVLSFERFQGLISLQVAGTLPKLRTVKLEFCPPRFHNVDIVAPSLRDLYLSSTSRELNLITVIACKTLTSLQLNGAVVTDEWVEQIFSCLPNIEIFCLISCPLLNTMKISSDRLKRLAASACDNLDAVDVDAPNLLLFTYGVHYGTTLKLKASHLLVANLNLELETPDSHWYSKLTKSLDNFSHSKSVNLRCHYAEEIVIPKDIRENLNPPLYATNDFHVNIQNLVRYTVVEVLDSLLWISPRLGTLSFDNGLKTLKFIYRDASDKDEKPCCVCASLPWKCWRHKLEKVKLRNFTCMELEKLRNYFFTNAADNFEIIEVSLECRL